MIENQETEFKREYTDDLKKRSSCFFEYERRNNLYRDEQ